MAMEKKLRIMSWCLDHDDDDENIMDGSKQKSFMKNTGAPVVIMGGGLSEYQGEELVMLCRKAIATRNLDPEKGPYNVRVLTEPNKKKRKGRLVYSDLLVFQGQIIERINGHLYESGYLPKDYQNQAGPRYEWTAVESLAQKNRKRDAEKKLIRYFDLYRSVEDPMPALALRCGTQMTPRQEEWYFLRTAEYYSLADRNEVRCWTVGFPKRTTREELRSYFSRYGFVEDVQLRLEVELRSKDETEFLPPFAFIFFTNADFMEEAVASSPHDFHGCSINLFQMDMRIGRSTPRHTLSDLERDHFDLLGTTVLIGDDDYKKIQEENRREWKPSKNGVDDSAGDGVSEKNKGPRKKKNKGDLISSNFVADVLIEEQLARTRRRIVDFDEDFSLYRRSLDRVKYLGPPEPPSGSDSDSEEGNENDSDTLLDSMDPSFKKFILDRISQNPINSKKMEEFYNNIPSCYQSCIKRDNLCYDCLRCLQMSQVFLEANRMQEISLRDFVEEESERKIKEDLLNWALYSRGIIGKNPRPKEDEEIDVFRSLAPVDEGSLYSFNIKGKRCLTNDPSIFYKPINDKLNQIPFDSERGRTLRARLKSYLTEGKTFTKASTERRDSSSSSLKSKVPTVDIEESDYMDQSLQLEGKDGAEIEAKEQHEINSKATNLKIDESHRSPASDELDKKVSESTIFNRPDTESCDSVSQTSEHKILSVAEVAPEVDCQTCPTYDGSSSTDNCVSSKKVKLRQCSWIECQKWETSSKTFKKCEKCHKSKIKLPRYYCGVDCQMDDWKSTHKEEHRKWKKTDQ